MNLTERTDGEINRMINHLASVQSDDGSWHFCAESGPMTDAYMIMLLKTLEWEDDRIMNQLADRLLKKQDEKGFWKLYHDENEGNLSATIEACFALLYLQKITPDDPRVTQAKQYIRSKGGLGKAEILTKVMLALHGQYPWHNPFMMPLELLLPTNFPINIFELSPHARVHIIPVLIAAHFQYAVNNEHIPDLSELLLNPKTLNPDPNYRKGLLKNIVSECLRKLFTLPLHLRDKAIEQAEQFMLHRIEGDGTLYSYFSATFLMIYALRAFGYDKRHPIIINAINGSKGLLFPLSDGTLHQQNFSSTVWDTSLINYALQEAGVSTENPAILKAKNYLFSRQHTRYGDWAVHNPHIEPGGWGYSDINTINPDNDDTAAALRAIRGYAITQDVTALSSWNRGLQWLLSMQNEDGGWAAFEKSTDMTLLSWLPIEHAKDVLTDPSSVDLSGRVLEFLGSKANLKKEIPFIKRAVDWLLKKQESDGSWYGRWGISYIYGTWAAITGLRAAGVSTKHPSVRKALHWLYSIQNKDGGFGESCRSDVRRKYIALEESTPSQTAWALDALLSASDTISPEMEKAAERLISFSEQTDWTVSYPTGAGLPGGFYIRYHSYRWIWPLLALAHFRKRVGTN